MQITKSNRNSRTFGTLCLVALAGLSLAIAGGTSQAASAPSKDSPAQVGAASKFDKDQYTVEITGSSSCKAGSECKATISLKSKGDFHINDKYPLKFKAPDTAPEGVSFTKTTVKKEDGSFKEKEGTLPIGFTIAKAGKAKIGGTFSFSVCSDANCVMEKLDLEVEVEAK